MKNALTIVVLSLVLGRTAAAQTPADIVVERAAQPPTVDGILDDEVWKRPPMPIGEWVSYQPVRGDTMSADLRTEVRVAYDDRHIYFAFRCFDNEPDKIRTNVSKRDSAFSDDWIALSLDSAGTGQSAYHLFSNPSGSQMDALNTSASGEQFDADMVWFSAAKTTSDGYVVEVQIPLQTLRFAGADQVRMGVVFLRKISRMGSSYAWPEMLPGQWVFDRPAHLVFSNLKPRRLVELLPSVTYGVSQTRETTDRWNGADGDPNIGINGKLGITSGITLDGTINPDFSQVESDSFQVEVNQRFPVFYSEKRPFFMEGMGLFNIAGAGGPSNMRTGVHTRRIVNPIWGSKLTGTAGKATFGVLNALDDSPEDIGGRGAAVADRHKLTTIARATYALRRSDYIGAIVTDTRHAGRHNLVAGGDLSIRLSPTQRLSATILSSRTTTNGRGGEPSGPPDVTGTGAQAFYHYETRRFSSASQVEHYGREFQMDTAFYNRTGFTSAWTFTEVNFYPQQSWMQRVHPFVFGKFGHDEVQDGGEDFILTGVAVNFTRQGFLEIARSQGHETWRGQRFKAGNDFQVFFGMQALRWLSVRGGMFAGPATYYDDEPFQGNSRNGFVGVTVQPNAHLTQEVEVNAVRFDRASTGVRVYGVDIINAKTTYQFDKHFLVRFLAQFDSSAKRVLTDFLASYEFVPGTVFHAGYGSLYEKRVGPGGAFVPVDQGERYLSVNRGLFFKASYLRRF